MLFFQDAGRKRTLINLCLPAVKLLKVEIVEKFMEYIKVTNENIDKEHICCAISNNNDIQVSSKKEWLKEQFTEGLVFLKSAERGKCFIEYLPAENAWNPIVSFRAVHLQSKEDAQNAPTPVTTYALFYDGAYLTNEQMNDRKFLKLLSK